MKANQKITNLTQLSLLTALVVALQMLSAVIPPIGGTVSITLTLVPVVIGGIILGKKGGAVLGFAFGVIVLINCVVALDPGGNILWNASPLLTALICLVKGTAAGFLPACLYGLVRGNGAAGEGRVFAATLVAALSAPIVNTGLFIAGMALLFKDTLYLWAGETNVVTYALLGLAGLNFLVEFIINIVLTPAILRIITVVTKKGKI